MENYLLTKQQPSREVKRQNESCPNTTVLWKLKTLIKEIKDDTNEWKGIPCSWIGSINTGKCTYAPKHSTDSMQSISKYQQHIFTELEQTILKSVICMEPQKTHNSQSNLEKEQQS